MFKTDAEFHEIYAGSVGIRKWCSKLEYGICFLCVVQLMTLRLGSLFGFLLAYCGFDLDFGVV